VLLALIKLAAVESDGYDGWEQPFGVLLFAFLFSCLLLPVTIGAAIRRRVVIRQNELATVPWLPPSSDADRLATDLEHLEP
jgi:hypothetical protein